MPAILLLIFFTACGGKIISADASLTEIRAELEETVSSECVLVSAEYLETLYGVDLSICEDYAAFRISADSFPGSVILLRARDDAAVEKLSASLNTFLEQLRGQTRDYAPESHALAEKTEVSVQGLYVTLFFAEEAEELKSLFTAHLREYTLEEEPHFTPEPVIAAPTSTAEPTPEPAADPEKEMIPYGLVPAGERVPESYWNDVLFVGDSIAGNLADYITEQRLLGAEKAMGNATLFTVNRFSYHEADNGKKNGGWFPSLGNGYLDVWEAVEQTGARKIYFYMGMNDLARFQGDSWMDTAAHIRSLVGRIREVRPAAEIFLCSLNPRLEHFYQINYDNADIREFNARLLELCKEENYYYVNCYDCLADEEQGLKQEYYYAYTQYDGNHLNSAGCAVLLEELYTHAVG